MNRMILLLGVLFCICLPFIHLEIPVEVVKAPVIYMEQAVVEQIFVPDIPNHFSDINQVTEREFSKTPFTSIHYVFYFWLTGCIVNIVYLLYLVRGLLAVLKNGRRVVFPEYTLILCKQEIIAFTIGRFIFISASDYLTHKEEIVNHELAHLSLKHSWDVLFMEIILSIHWFNPFVWWIRREMKNIHEYQADSTVLSKGIDAITYQLLLVEKAVGSSSYTFASSFNQSKIKKRISMMLKEKSSNWTRLKSLFLIPFVAVMLVAFARPGVENPEPDVLTAIENVLEEKQFEEALSFVTEFPEVKPDTIKQEVITYFVVDGETYSPGKYNDFAKGKKVYMFRKDIPEGKKVYVVRQGWKNHPSQAPLTPEMYLVDENDSQQEEKESVEEVESSPVSRVVSDVEDPNLSHYIIDGKTYSIKEYNDFAKGKKLYILRKDVPKDKKAYLVDRRWKNRPSDAPTPPYMYLVEEDEPETEKKESVEEVETPSVSRVVSESQQ